MKIRIAKSSGFCMGVRRAVEMVLDAPGRLQKPIYTYGPLIHNPQVLDLLKEKGVTVLDKIPETGSGTVLIRAHGVPPQAKEALKKSGFRVVDATCPRVIRVQTIIRKHSQKGYASIIIGDKNHPEVIGLLGYAGDKGYVVDSIDELHALPSFDRAIIVAQTTQNTSLYERVRKWSEQRYPHYKLFVTICDSTEKRQAEVKNLSKKVDAIVVVGGYSSGNTKRLAEIAKQSAKSAIHVESADDLNLKSLSGAKTIGLTAGASTPNWTIKKVYRALETLPFKKTQGWRSILFNIQRTLLLTNIYVSLGAGGLCYACTRLTGISQHFPHMLIAIFYVQSMHILNNLTGTNADRYNDPDRASFYDDHYSFLTLLAVAGGSVGLITAYTLGIFPFLILLIMSATGLSYNRRILPRWKSSARYLRLKDIPGSKTILITMAWGVVTTLLPTLSIGNSAGIETVLVFFWTTSLVFVRSAFFDILDVQGDRIVGKGTIPILLGEKKTLRLLKRILAALIVLSLLSAASGVVSHLAVALIFCPAFLWVVLTAHEHGHMHPGIRLEFLVETIFVSAGVITLVWSLIMNL